MIVLDTDHVVELLKGTGPGAARLIQRLKSSGEEPVATIITVEEILRGWLAEIRRVADSRFQVVAYARLQKAVVNLAAWRILPWDIAAAEQFEKFRKQRVRVGTADLKIASIAYGSSAKVLTRNARDFAMIPGLRIEDWLS